jgi:plastocyanin
MLAFRLLLWVSIGTLCAATVVACAGEIVAHTIEARDDLTFTPNSITVKAGQTVELTLVNHGKLNHTFTAPDLNIEVQMPAGVTSRVTFSASNPGEYRFFSAALSEFEVMKGIVIVK